MEFLFALLPGFNMQSFSSAVEVLRVANKLSDDVRLPYKVIGTESGPVAASNGIELIAQALPDGHFTETILIVVAGEGTATSDNSAALSLVRVAKSRGCKIWGISSGVVIMAQAGLLRGRMAAPHWEDMPYLREMHPDVEISKSLFILDDDYATCAGGFAGADLMLCAMERFQIGLDRDEITARLIMDHARDGRLDQMVPQDFRFQSSNRIVFGAIEEMRAHIFEPLAISEIARRLKVSQRQMERLFVKEINKSPGKVYTEIRLVDARQDVLRGLRPMSEIALDYGFSIGGFSKVYKQIFGRIPTEDRKLSHLGGRDA